ncbi:hypothetical protein M427DRAFT_59201 [Gonapodya prolifera JEL478]|uniref:Formate/nitrite transporter n=1 Tax=Gonapodya prolifera (strain JEL478) TaxID=1344416 RepID=A0A139A7W5_GONPJ|nr:hypothetical protein M427DRAFT_59201 [Gonapodya prolifera JEL478]|eukprot:KXS12901.1 hypothetical protein M427DRAFT_59201 [Gonapodya prolifera JEL478]
MQHDMDDDSEGLTERAPLQPLAAPRPVRQTQSPIPSLDPTLVSSAPLNRSSTIETSVSPSTRAFPEPESCRAPIAMLGDTAETTPGSIPVHIVSENIPHTPTPTGNGPIHHVLSARHLMDLVRGHTPRPGSTTPHPNGTPALPFAVSEHHSSSTSLGHHHLANTKPPRSPSPGNGKRHPAPRDDPDDAYVAEAWPEDLQGDAGQIGGKEGVPEVVPMEEDSAFRAKDTVKIDDINKGEALETIVANLGVKKNEIPWDKTLFLSILAGFFVSQGCIFALSAGGGIPLEIRQAYPAISKLLLGMTFPVGLFYIVLFGGELFTGNTMILVVSLLNRRISAFGLLRNWTLVYLGNLAACLLCGYLFGFITDVFKNEPYLSYISAIGVTKTTLPWHVLFLRGIPANALVCLSIFLGLAARDVTGKIIAMWIPIVTFAVIGYEHCVANMMFVPLSIYYGANVTWAGFWYNQSAVVLGNIIGGGLLIGGSEYFMYHWNDAAEPEKHSGKWGRSGRHPPASTLAPHESLAAINAMTFGSATPTVPPDAGDSTGPVMRARIPSRPEPIALTLTPLHAGPPSREADGVDVTIPSNGGRGVFTWGNAEVPGGAEVLEMTGRSRGGTATRARKRTTASATGVPEGAVSVTVEVGRTV